MSTMIPVAEELKFLVPVMMELLAQVGQIMTRTTGSRGGHSVDYGQVECLVAEQVAKLERTVHQGLLQSLDIDAPGLLIQGKTYQRVGRNDGTFSCGRNTAGTPEGKTYQRVGRNDGIYYTMAGSCQVACTRYQEEGQPNGPWVNPVSLRAGVILEGWLPQTAAAMAHQVQMNTAREAQKAAEQTYRLPYSDSSFERVAHAVGALYHRNELDVEQKLIEQYQVPSAATGVSISLDRVSVPMEEPHPTNPTAITRAYRMSFCGTVTVHNREGKALHTIRYGRMPQGDAMGLVEAMASDVDVMRQQRPDLLVTSLADGAADVWDLLDSQINPQELHTKVVRLIDLWHWVEKLGKAARVIHGEQRSDSVVTRWKLGLLNDSTAAEQILAELHASGYREVRVGDTRPVHEAITYLENHRDPMDYATARQQGRPVGSGAVEATCKSLFEIRMKRPGARWKQGTGEDIVRLRALALSDRWQPAMRRVLAPLRTAVQRAA